MKNIKLKNILAIDYLLYFLFGLGLFAAFFATVFVIWGAHGEIINLRNSGEFLASIALALISLGVAILSWEIAVKSANEAFLQLIDTFENRRLELQKNTFSIWEIELTSWKCKLYAERAVELKKHVKKKNQEEFVNHYVNLLNTFPWKDTIIRRLVFKEEKFQDFTIKTDKFQDFKINKNTLITLTDVENLLITYENIRKLKIDTEKKEKPIEILEKYIGNRKKDEGIDEYIERKKKEISMEKKARGNRAFFY